MTLPLQKATYRALATSAPVKFGKSSKGNLEIAVEFEVLEKNEADEDVPTGEFITWIGHFTDKTANRTIESLQTAGWQGEDVADLLGVSAASELPTPVDLVCEPEEWDGAWKLKVQWVNKPGAGRFAFKESISDSELKAFGAQLRANVKAVRASGGAPRAPKSGGGGSRPAQSRHPNAPGADDDIPF